MSELINAYDSYNDFERYAYFTVCYDALPSNVKLEFTLSETKENMEAVMAAIDFDEFQIKPVYKNWTTEDVKNPDPSKEYPYQYLMKSESKKLVIWIVLNNEELFVDFLYDLTDPGVEAWVLATNHTLRTQFGEMRTPTFKVMSRNDKRFFTEDVSTGDFAPIKVAALYNDDFQEIDKLICDSMTTNESGLILLHGEPGTGKTSYIKNLIAKFPDKAFIFVQNEFIRDLLKPEFISFLLKHRNAALIIEDAEKVIMSREYANEGSVVSTILQLTDGLFSDYLNIKIICTFNTGIEKVDSALTRKGRLIAKYAFKPLSKEKTVELMKSLGHEPLEETMTLADIFKLKQKGFKGEEKKKIGFG